MDTAAFQQTIAEGQPLGAVVVAADNQNGEAPLNEISGIRDSCEICGFGGVIHGQIEQGTGLMAAEFEQFAAIQQNAQMCTH